METPLIWAEIDLKVIAENVKKLRSITLPSARLMVAVKANGYGHGMIEVSRIALENGASALGVARLEEGIQLRKAGINAPVLIFGYTPIDMAEKIIEYDLTQTVGSVTIARKLSDLVASRGKKLRIHLKIDTGMGRFGFLPEENGTVRQLAQNIESVAELPYLETEGIFSHFATADAADKTYACKQLETFLSLLKRLDEKGIKIPVHHIANSAAIIDMPESHLDMVRAGISFYGLFPSQEVNISKISLKPAMSFKTRVVHIKQVPAEFKISYGCTYETDKPTVIATVAAGYADGLNRLLSSNGEMLVRGKRAPIVGCVCMDQTMIDVGHIPDVQVGDEVVIFGRQGDGEIHVDELAEKLNTINYEIVSTITDRVKRIYV
ncbi:MAG: alanine racemase [Desulfobacterales bacterium]|nr:alanine racemase [Desulfobacterales bacterium]